MKKGWKIFWTVCAVIGVLGIGMFAAGCILGPTKGTLRTAFVTGSDEIWHFGDDDDDDEYLSDDDDDDDEDLSDDDDEDWDLDDDDDDDDKYLPETSDSEWKQEFEGVESIEIELAAAAVKVLPYDGDKVVVDRNGMSDYWKKKVSSSMSGSKLKIHTSKVIRAGKNTGSLCIYVPANLELREISMESGAGRIEMKEIHAKEISLEIGAGQGILEGFSAEKLEVECGAGEILLQGEVTRKAEIDCGVGTVEFEAKGEYEDYDYEISCGMGEVVIDGKSYSGLDKDQTIKNGSDRKIEADCGMGKIEISYYK